MTRHNNTFPNESDEYRQRRFELLEEEIKLRSQIEKVAEQRRALPLGGKISEDFAFDKLNTEQGVEIVKISELFEAGKDTLVIYSFMYDKSPCSMCTAFLDSLNGNAKHVEQRINLVVTAKTDIKTLSAFGQSRNWNQLSLLSRKNNDYGINYHAENDDGVQIPGISVFVRKSDGIYHTYTTELFYCDLDGQPRGIDSSWPLWNMFDFTPEGRGEDWYPNITY